MSQVREIFVRIDRCTGCRSCEIACAVEHSSGKSLFAAISETPVPRKRLYIEAAEDYNIPLLCRHCEDAPCVRSCITGALSQHALTRVVSHDADRCIGCWMCTMVCPYGVIGRKKEQRVAVKCDRCPYRDEPACVGACPTQALVFAEEESFVGSVRASAASNLAASYAAEKQA
ncbi:MAG: 4Fe-4S dicluster domain-containing protein [Deltaproteobacteria bacterium]|jgi:carbon-monoxide dehydrogenase iron sulfur subunit|nr:4Fe-4S dicluster domain-containing protein [Deltaproteobacteria bacterium]